MATLNTSKPYGQVHGNAKHAFEQDGKLFNSQGKEVDAKGNLIGKAEAPTLTLIDDEPEKDARTVLVEKVEQMTVAQIKDALTVGGVEFDDKLLKADLVSLLVDEELAE